MDLEDTNEDVKENTKKTRYSFKKGSGITRDTSRQLDSHTFMRNRETIIDWKDKIDFENEVGIIYYSINEEQYEDMDKKLKQELIQLFDTELKNYDKHIFLINNNKSKEQIEEILNNNEKFNSLISKIISVLLHLDSDNYPTISWIVSNILSKRYQEYRYWETTEYVLNNMIRLFVKTNHNLKNLFQIAHPKKAEYMLRSNYRGKSENYNQNKSRKWRRKIEKNRIQKERKEVRKSIKDDF